MESQTVVSFPAVVASPPSIANIAKALSAAQRLVKPALRDRDNPYFKSKYADLASVTAAIQEPFTSNGLSWTQPASTSDDLACAVITTWLMHVSGEMIQSQLRLKLKDSSPTTFGATVALGRRYALAAIAGLATDDDDDGAAELTAPKVSRAEAIKAAVAPKVPTPWQRIEAMRPADMSPADLASVVKTVTGKPSRNTLDDNDVALVQSALSAEVAK